MRTQDVVVGETDIASTLANCSCRSASHRAKAQSAGRSALSRLGLWAADGLG
ncbi:hypothetical protein [Kitasatospora sp. NBC_00315]|uniref:hypothetical protein n=1 Tax=Kitasatospora sp. NBC_00315 TaxID=2975963 RepID=UPI00324CD631